MPTKSAIGIRNADNTVDAITVYYDGGLDYVGLILHEHYQREEKVRHLMYLGHLRVLMAQLQDCQQVVTFVSPESDGAQTFNDPNHFYGGARSAGAEFSYLFDNGTWYVMDYVQQSISVLQEALADE